MQLPTALRIYFENDMHVEGAYTPLGTELAPFYKTLTNDERVEAKEELRSYGMEVA